MARYPEMPRHRTENPRPSPPLPTFPPRRLVPHSSTPTPWIESLEVDWAREAGGRVALRYILAGDIGLLKIPPPQTPARRDGLWRHTCFELFVAGAQGPAYREFNFSPSGQWQAYAFRTYRQGGPLDPAPAPAIVREIGDERLVLEARLALGAPPSGERLRVGLSAVLEGRDGSLSYWALRHSPGKPDFHHPDTFALEIDLRNPQS